MVVSVISPHCGGNGNTVTALFTALGLGNMKKKVLLTHTDSVLLKSKIRYSKSECSTRYLDNVCISSLSKLLLLLVKT